MSQDISCVLLSVVYHHRRSKGESPFSFASILSLTRMKNFPPYFDTNLHFRKILYFTTDFLQPCHVLLRNVGQKLYCYVNSDFNLSSEVLCIH